MSGFYRFKTFGRKIFSAYDKYPLLANTIIGGVVYATSEAIVQYQSNRDPKLSLMEKVNLKKVSEIGALGSVENGILMTTWYFYYKYILPHYYF